MRFNHTKFASAPREEEERAPPVVINAPESIWLCMGDFNDALDDIDFKELFEITWCEDAQSRADVKYVRADLVAKMISDAVMDAYPENEMDLLSKAGLNMGQP